MDSLLDHTALELRKGAGDLKHELAHWRGRIDCLLVEVKIYVGGLKRLDGAEQIDERSTEPVNRPRHDNVKVVPFGVLEHLVQTGPDIAAFTPAYPGVAVLVDDFPAAALGDLAQFPDLIVDGLLVGAYTNVDCCPFLHLTLPQVRFIIPIAILESIDCRMPKIIQPDFNVYAGFSRVISAGFSV